MTADASVFTPRVDNVNQVGVADPKQLDDVGFVTSLSASGTYGLSDDKATALKFSGSAQTHKRIRGYVEQRGHDSFGKSWASAPR